ncbi:MAG: type IV pilus assembly protein PilM [Thermodesulfobacteriota bacterium]
MGLFDRGKSILGLDIGSHTIKAIVLDQAKSGMLLSAVGLVNLPPQAIVDGAIQEKGVIVAAVKNLLNSLKVKVKNVCTSISGYSVIIKKITLPTATREELAKSIEVEAEQFIPFDISEVNVDFQIIGESERNPEQMEVILVAAKKDVIGAYMELLVESGLKPTIIDIDVFALENAFTHSYPEVQETVALVDIGANKMNINIIRQGMSLLTKDAAMGGARITDEIQDKFDLEYQEAEAVKLGAQASSDPEAVTEIVSRAVENWVAEAKRTLDYMQASYPGEKLSRIYLSGGSCRIPGLEQLFTKQLEVPVELLNPFLKVGVNTSKFDPTYIEYLAPQVSVCLGLALRRGEKI